MNFVGDDVLDVPLHKIKIYAKFRECVIGSFSLLQWEKVSSLRDG